MLLFLLLHSFIFLWIGKHDMKFPPYFLTRNLQVVPEIQSGRLVLLFGLITSLDGSLNVAAARMADFHCFLATLIYLTISEHP